MFFKGIDKEEYIYKNSEGFDIKTKGVDSSESWIFIHLYSIISKEKDDII